MTLIQKSVWMVLVSLVVFAPACSQKEPETIINETGKESCQGATPPKGSEQAPKAPDEPADGQKCKDSPKDCVGKPWPLWKLLDVQPQSCGHKKYYGLDTFKGHVTVVALLASW